MKRRRSLSKSEDALWRLATKSVRPLRRKSPAPEAPVAIGERSNEEVAPVRSRPRKAPVAPPAAGKPRKRSAASAFASGDPALDKKARRGRIEIERSLDLHGLRETSAHARLRSFLMQASRDGCRCVLVITGKGEAGGADGPNAKPRGVIRRRFQDWINEEALRPLVSRAAPAQTKHGGAGAVYVFLKARR